MLGVFAFRAAPVSQYCINFVNADYAVVASYCCYTMTSNATAASVFRRGGPKKELFDENQTDGAFEIQDADRKSLEAQLDQLLEVLQVPKAGKELSAAFWRPEVGAAELVLTRRGTAQAMGFKWRRKYWLHPEEAAFLVDRSDLLLFLEQPGALPGGGKPEPRLLSLQETLELMVMAGISMERYLVYSMLSKSGYLLMRYPSCWMVPLDMSPSDVWGHGAWAGCAGLRAAPLPGGLPAAIQHVKALNQGKVPAKRVTLAGEEDEDGNADDAGVAKAGEKHSEASNTGKVAGKAHQSPHTEDGASASVTDMGKSASVQATDQPVQGSAAEDEAKISSQTRSWWPITGALPIMTTNCHSTCEQHSPETHNEMAFAPSGTCLDEEDSGKRHLDHLVENSFRKRVKTGTGFVSTANGPDVSAPALKPTDTRHANASDADQRQQQEMEFQDDPPSHSYEPCPAEAIKALCPLLKPLQRIPQAEVLPGEPASTQGLLVYDVYKPGCHVARMRKVFPELAAHICICSSRPPRPHELRLADSQAVSDTVPVKWVTVEGGIVSFYGINKADIMPLF